MSGDLTELAPGARLGPYEIQKKLGSGGMGSVYLATDLQLRRPVALKLLSEEKAFDTVARRRLIIEAQAASALNHANIVTVYQIGSEGPRDFIAMEYVAGKTLNQLVPYGGLPMHDVLRYAIQVAGALAAAHEAGIVHRDLKPGNIMVTERGVVKVVDFGLAKRAAARSAAGDQEATDTFSLTTPGFVAGTCAYMSPEQVQAKDVDGRSDIWAFGCVLYYMLSGRHAFHGETQMDTLAAVLAKDPPALHEIGPFVPAAMERFISRCLQKKVAERWQSAADLKLILEEFERENGIAAAEARVPRHSRLRLAAGVAAGCLLGIAGMWVAQRRPPAAAGQAVMRMVTLDAGLNAFPSLSRDGSLLAFASDRGGGGNLDIWVQQVGGREPIRLTDDPADDTTPSMSPDGTKVAFRSERNGGGIYVVGALGGQAVLVAAGGRDPKFSPDGQWIAYWSGRDAGLLAGAAKVYVVESGGGTPRQIGTSLASALHPVWSPKGEDLLAVARNDANLSEQQSVDWWVLPLANGTPRKTGAFDRLRAAGLLRPQSVAAAPFEWLEGPPARVTFSATLGDATNLWETPVSVDGAAEGPPRRLTAGPGRQVDSSTTLAKSSVRMAFADEPQNTDIWMLPADTDRGAPRGDFSRITQYASGEYSPSISLDGSKMVFISRLSASYALRYRDLGSGREYTLLSGDRFLPAAVLAGNGSLVFFSNGDGDIFGLAPGGGAAEEYCHRCGTVMGASPDGGSVLYEPIETEDLTLWDVRSRAGRKIALRPSPASVLSGGRFSPDGRWAAFHQIDNRNATARVWLTRADAATPAQQSEWIAVTDGSSVERDPAWAPGGNLLYFLSERDGFRCIWARRLDSSKRPAGEAFAVKHFHAARWSLSSIARGFQIGLSVGNGRILFALGELTGNIWMQETPLPAR
jgi:Tol biopolymer transport system component